jgi:hypothetical protein
MVCGDRHDLTADCLSDETALSTELLRDRQIVDETDTRHAICGAGAQWQGSFPKCLECNATAIDAGRCGAVCAFEVDDVPRVRRV